MGNSKKLHRSIEIIGTESLGVRGLSCLVKVGKRRIVIDPGVALGYLRHGFLPHPLQVAEGERVRQRIITALTTATDVVFSHFHGSEALMDDSFVRFSKAVLHGGARNPAQDTVMMTRINLGDTVFVHASDI